MICSINKSSRQYVIKMENNGDHSANSTKYSTVHYAIRLTLQGSPKYMRPWLREYVAARCLKVSSSGVREGEERTLLNMELGVLSKGNEATRAPP